MLNPSNCWRLNQEVGVGASTHTSSDGRADTEQDWSLGVFHSVIPMGRAGSCFFFPLNPSIQGYIQRSWCEITFVISAAYHIYQIYYQYKCLCGNNILETGILIFDDSR